MQNVGRGWGREVERRPRLVGEDTECRMRLGMGKCRWAAKLDLRRLLRAQVAAVEESIESQDPDDGERAQKSHLGRRSVDQRHRLSNVTDAVGHTAQQRRPHQRPVQPWQERAEHERGEGETASRHGGRGRGSWCRTRLPRPGAALVATAALPESPRESAIPSGRNRPAPASEAM
eukprot:scaffold18983_cov101-Isochrysis_galbana.AAC.1